MSASKIIAVTGATGFLGSHVAGQLLEEGYAVRLTARGQKAERLREALGRYGDRVEVVSIADISSGDFKAAFEGAWAVIHVASPLPAKSDSQTMIKSAVDGTINVLAQAVKYGIQKVVVTGSAAALRTPGDKTGSWSDRKWDESDWGDVKQEDVTDDKLDPFAVYGATKILSEKALWKFAEEHKEIDIATILPPFIYGPFRPDFPSPASIADISTDSMILPLITGSSDRAFPHQASASYIDVRDAARAHVRALTVPPSPADPQAKRYIVRGGSFTWKAAVELIAEKRPELKGALPDVAKAPSERPVAVAVAERAKAKLGMVEYLPWQKTVLDTVDDLVKVKSSWEEV